jgi:uncharacterized protein YjeT (DUF2065 family)
VGGAVHDVWGDGVRLSTSRDFVGRPSVAGRFVFARTVRGEVMALSDGAWRQVAAGVAGDPEAVLRPDGTVALYAVLADGSVAKLSDPAAMIGMGGSSPQGAGQSGSIPLSPPGFAVGKPSAIARPDGSVAVYVRSGGALVVNEAGTWREVATGLDSSPEAVLRPDGTVGLYALFDGRPHRLTTTWELLSDSRYVDTVSAQPDGTVYARKADGTVLKVG